MTICLLLAALSLPARASVLADPRVAAAIKGVEQTAGKREAGELRDRLTQAQKSARRVRGCVVAGRLRLDGPGDPEAVVAQMAIFPGGFFADAYDPAGAPLGFRAPGYEALDVKPQCKDGLAWVELEMTPAPPERRGRATARLSLPGSDARTATVSVYPALADTNIEGAGVDAREACRVGQRCPSIAAPTASIDPAGVLVSSGLSPVAHGLSVSAPGFVAIYSTFPVRPGETTDLGVVALERAKRLRVRWLAADNPPFAGPPKVSIAQAGQPWSSIPRGARRSWSEIVFEQKDGRVFLRPATGPADVADLGPGRLEDFARKAGEKSLDPKAPYRLPLVDGHVYLLRERYFGRWLLLTATVAP